jgi:hypothetical protein
MLTSVLEAKAFCNDKTNSRLTAEEADAQIAQLRGYIEDSEDLVSKALFEDMISGLIQWKNSSELEKGEYPQGIDQIILDLIEIRSLIFAIQNTPNAQPAFEKHFFFQQWLIGAAHTITCGIGKLVSGDNRDNSLRNLWKEVGHWITLDGACTQQEADFIDQALDKKTGHFVNANSKAFNYRNKSVAHNEHSPTITWEDFDPDLKILVRTWSLLVAWCSFGIIAPFKERRQIFDGLETLYSKDVIRELGSKREQYLQKVRDWATTYLHNEAADPGRGAFTSGIKITVALEQTSNDE